MTRETERVLADLITKEEKWLWQRNVFGWGLCMSCEAGRILAEPCTKEEKWLWQSNESRYYKLCTYHRDLLVRASESYLMNTKWVEWLLNHYQEFLYKGKKRFGKVNESTFFELAKNFRIMIVHCMWPSTLKSLFVAVRIKDIKMIRISSKRNVRPVRDILDDPSMAPAYLGWKAYNEEDQLLIDRLITKALKG